MPTHKGVRSNLMIVGSFLTRFEDLKIDCNDQLHIYDGAHAIGNPKVKKVNILFIILIKPLFLSFWILNFLIIFSNIYRIRFFKKLFIIIKSNLFWFYLIFIYYLLYFIILSRFFIFNHFLFKYFWTTSA